MPYIALPEGYPGIRSLAAYRPDTGAALYALAEALLRGDSALSQAEGELIATFTSSLNDCTFCASSHAAAARYLFATDQVLVDAVLADYQTAPISDKMKALLTIAKRVQQDARTVSEEVVEVARQQGATDREIHDTVLIAATFCMFNRYVDGLATLTPTDPAAYEPMGERMATLGYVPPKVER
ncbi:carboxymuconolactone decarboxylase family protein [Rhabdobacter roseus]|uniref:Putative peroxidase-related enzyme n=1 Tax=Rhabdobacter roseus TaxID=1655419 RepID=A0A840TF16_9BACT|nr:peroxidase-related enzyme [Rhabdobacter roseus]MBB5282094.1 putative peroxidase-related enzyme [Rhabdobacter roseus]